MYQTCASTPARTFSSEVKEYKNFFMFRNGWDGHMSHTTRSPTSSQRFESCLHQSEKMRKFVGLLRKFGGPSQITLYCVSAYPESLFH